ncbi:MAG TPA: universal stress protein [Natronosporangium sp.]
MDRGRVVVGVDTTLAGLHALRLAVAEARCRGLALHAVRTWGPVPAADLAGPPLRPTAAGLAAAIVDQAFAETMGSEPPDLPVRTVVLPDPPGPVLVGYACRDTDLLVLGAGRRRFPWSRGGPVVRYCLRHAVCPVLVVPPPPLTRVGSPKSLIKELHRELDQLGELGEPADQ